MLCILTFVVRLAYVEWNTAPLTMVMAMVKNTRLKTNVRISFFRMLMRLLIKIATGNTMTADWGQ